MFVVLIITQFAGGRFKSRAEFGASVVSYGKDIFPDIGSELSNPLSIYVSLLPGKNDG